MEKRAVAHLKLIQSGDGRHLLDIALPQGSTLAASGKVLRRVDELIHTLTGCPCNSGIDLRFRDAPTIAQIPNINENIELGG